MFVANACARGWAGPVVGRVRVHGYLHVSFQHGHATIQCVNACALVYCPRECLRACNSLRECARACVCDREPTLTPCCARRRSRAGL